MPPKVLVHGSGAIGAIYIHILQQAGCSVTAVCRSNYSAVKSDGFTIDSDKFGKNINVRPDHVVQNPAEAASFGLGPFDYIIVSTKALPGHKISTPQIIKPAVTEGKPGRGFPRFRTFGGEIGPRCHGRGCPDRSSEGLRPYFERKGTPGIEPSMLVDVLNGRRMEVEVILGNPVRIARELGVNVPRLETLYALLKGLDEAVALREPGRSLGGDETEVARR
jgi:hypothetical protein